MNQPHDLAPAMQEAAFDSYSLNGEDFQEGCASEALQALDDDGRLTLGAEYRLGVSQKPAPADFFDADHLIEQMQERAYDMGGEFAEDYLTELTDEQVLDLGRVVKAWLSSVNPRVTFFTVKEIQTFKITLEDIDERRGQTDTGAA
ncbi:hypothetical protein D3C87_1285420 [compost metagenome]